jgi:hypothetical protein
LGGTRLLLINGEMLRLSVENQATFFFFRHWNRSCLIQNQELNAELCIGLENIKGRKQRSKTGGTHYE